MQLHNVHSPFFPHCPGGFSVPLCVAFHSVQVPITDVYGPTAWDTDLQCLVVTTDTARGGEKVNEERKRKVSYYCRILFLLKIPFPQTGLISSGHPYG